MRYFAARVRMEVRRADGELQPAIMRPDFIIAVGTSAATMSANSNARRLLWMFPV